MQTSFEMQGKLEFYLIKHINPYANLILKTIFDKIGHSDRVPLVKERYLMTKLFNSASCCKIMASCKTLIGLQFTVDYSFNLFQYIFDFRFLFLTAKVFFLMSKMSSIKFRIFQRLLTTAWKLIPQVIRIYLDLNLLMAKPATHKRQIMGSPTPPSPPGENFLITLAIIWIHVETDAQNFWLG